MARIRTIKPDFFRHEGLQDLEVARPGLFIMLVFAGLWGQCDKSGRFEWKPRSLKLDILPFLNFDMALSLAALEEGGFVVRYKVDGKEYGEILTFEKHQRINGKEAQEPEKHPAPPEKQSAYPENKSGSTGEAPEKNMGSEGEAVSRPGREEEGKRKGREGNGEARGSRLPADWHPSGEDTQFCKTERPDLRPSEVAQRFYDHWIAKPGKDGRKTSWSATWRNWVRNEKRLAPPSGAPPGKFDLSNADHSSSEAAMAASVEKQGTVVPEGGAVSFDD